MEIGAVGSAFGAYYSAKSAKNNLQFQAQMSEINARTAELGAKGALLRGERDVQASKLRTAQLKGAQRAATAANGFDLGDETSARILTSTDVMGEIDANTIKTNAAREAWGYRAQGSNSTAQAGLYKMQADNQNPLMAGAGTLLSGAGSVADRWSKYGSKG